MPIPDYETLMLPLLQIAAEMNAVETTPQQRVPTPSRASVLPQMTIPEIPPFRGQSASPGQSSSQSQPPKPLQSPIRTQQHAPTSSQAQKPLPSLVGQQELPLLAGQKPLPPTQQSFTSFSPSSASRPDSGSSNDPFGGPTASSWQLPPKQQQVAQSPPPPPPTVPCPPCSCCRAA